MTLLITEADSAQLLTMQDAIAIAEETFRMAGEHTAENIARMHLFTPKGYMKLGPGALHEQGVMGFKVVANAGASVALNFLFSMDTAELLAVLQSGTLSRLRTSAVAAVAIKYLSREGADTLGLYGSGRLAEPHLEAALAVRPIRKVRVYSRSAEKREAFAARVSARFGIEVTAVAEPERAAEAEIVICITNTETPVLFGKWLTRAGLVISAGANHWYERELDEKVLAKADLVVVDEKEHAKIECGDLKWAIDHGTLIWDQVEQMGDVITGRVKLPDLATSTIVFESQGLGIHDVAISREAYQRARARGMGQEIALTGTAAEKQLVR